MMTLKKKLTKFGIALSMTVCAASIAQAADTIKIGFVGGVSGPCSPLVTPELNAVKMGVEEINAAGGILGKKVELIVRDGKTKPDESAKLARNLIINDKIDVLTGMCSSAVMLAMSSVSKELKTPFYSTIGSTQKANIEAYQPYFWQTQANAMMEAAASAYYVAAQKDWKRIVPMGFDYEWGHTSVKVFVDTLKSLRDDVEISDPIYPKIGEKNMLPYITTALSKKPDAVFAAVFGGGLINLIKQGESFDMFKSSNLVTMMTVDTLQSMGEQMPEKGIHGFTRAPFYALLDDPKAKSFVENYKEKYGTYPADWAVSGYDGLMFYKAAVEDAGTTEALKLLKSVGSISYDGLRSKGLTVRSFDGQMNAPTYVGSVVRDGSYKFSIMGNLKKYKGEDLMLSEEEIASMRKAESQK